jgi:hypothetical protein
MSTALDSLKSFVERLRSVSLLERIFAWKAVRNQLIDAAAALAAVQSQLATLQAEKVEGQSQLSALRKDLALAREEGIRGEGARARLSELLAEKEARLAQLASELSTEKADHRNVERGLQALTNDYHLLKENYRQVLAANKELAEEISANKVSIETLSGRNAELSHEASVFKERLATLTTQVDQLNTDLATATEGARNSQQKAHKLETDLALLTQKLAHAEQELRATRDENLRLKGEEEHRQSEHGRSLASLTGIRDAIQAEREAEKQERTELELERLRRLKETWVNHQAAAQAAIKSICSRHTIEYVEKVPFRGDPDNTLRICEEYIVFDAKSPGSDDLTNFPHYIKDQAEKARKYARQEGVKSEIFFVVPSNTLEALKQHCYPMADYTVYVVSLDALEPIILCLRKIEDYEFAGQLSPEERENICRIIGKFAHLSKRRIQIDSFFARQFIEIAYKCESNLPEDILAKVVEFEKSEKLNPPMEKRAKAINTKQLEVDAIKIEAEAGSKGILIEDMLLSSGLNQTPLYKGEG